ncbi:MAG: transglutaminase family protein [Deltaproteobacteria bacterium]|nr:transglutaminase family protein [Deltaproteobacteria bacterium]
MDMQNESFLQATDFIDSDHETVRAFAHDVCREVGSAEDKAIQLYYAVRDGIRYTPYLDFADPEMYRASSVLRNGYGFCVSKAALLAACGRVLEIPSRVGFADVTNHLNTPRLREMNGGDLMRWHAFTEFYLQGSWIKATPAFNLELCTRFRVKPLEFNGREDSIFHPFDADQRRHMEYVHDRGSFADIPFAAIVATFRKHSPKLFGPAVAGDFSAEAQPS